MTLFSICLFFFLVFTFIVLSASEGFAEDQLFQPSTGINDDDVIGLKWKEINVKSPPLKFSLVLYICGIENYQCKKIKDSGIITLPQVGINTMDHIYYMRGKNINWIIENELDKKSENYQLAVHFFRNPDHSYKELIGVTDIPYSKIQMSVWKEYKVNEPFEAHFDPYAFVDTHFEVAKFDIQDIDFEIEDDVNGSPDGEPIDDPSINPLPATDEEGGLSIDQYENIINTVEGIYVHLAKKINKRLKFIRQWDDDTQDAITGYEEDADGKLFTMKFPGGLARNKLMSKEAYTLVVCHEVAHHLGGSPTFPDGASVEGQADYFAAYDCLRRVLLKNGALFKEGLNFQLPVLVQFFCSKAFNDEINIKMCKLISYYGQRITDFFATKKGLSLPQFETPSLKKADKYFEVGEDPHPPLQCRLDTYFAAALCNQHPISKSIKDNMINIDNAINKDNEDNIDNSINIDLSFVQPCKHGEQFALGERPVCWFIP